jgi:hypothetical protein
MRRLLIVGSEVPNFASIPWSDWNSGNALDYQGLLLDFRDPKFLPNQGSIAVTLTSLVNNNHTAYILLPEAKSAPSNALTFLFNYYIYIEKAVGQTLKVNAGEPFFEAYRSALTGHEICFRLQQLPNTSGWPIFTGIIDNVSRVICCKVASIYLLHPPSKKLEQKALKVIIDHFKPDPFPISNVSKPSWVDQAASALPGVADIQAVRASLRQEIQLKSEQLKLEEERLRKLSSWADLLWLEGLPLQTKVSEALNLLGISSGTSDPSGHTCDLTADEAGTHFVFEVTGSSSTIGIEKGRQLMQWVTESADPANAKGVLVASAFRGDPPDKRPPTPDRRIFVIELERFAARYHLALLDIRELYRVLCMKLSGQTVDKSQIVNGLSADGVVRFEVS